ncbi:TPA: hypothetical protein DEP34_04920 [Candidatus Uhrbacteria bacterium]|nr:hypothetical protein [Candidatus Uhrbacteria bacterium]HCB19683.1 hypothetical protein [Candidatus Uhrbacteria bacterium]
MSLFRPSLESSPSAAPAEAGVRRTSEILGEAIMDSVSSVRDSLPKEHRVHFETLRQEIIDFTQAHGISRESLGKPDLLREATGKLSIPDLERLALLLECFEHLIVKKEPWKNTEALEYGEKFYHLREQYDSQVELLEQVGILKEGAILGIDGNTYPIPTLEQIASRIFERRETLQTKRDQGFTKLLLVPFGMSLNALMDVFKKSIVFFKQSHPEYTIFGGEIMFDAWSMYFGGDTPGRSGQDPQIIYFPTFFDPGHSQGFSKTQILKKQTTAESTTGWFIRFFQPANFDSSKDASDIPQGIASIPKKGKGVIAGQGQLRLPIEEAITFRKCLSLLQEAEDDPGSPYVHESGLTPEDWLLAYLTHLMETGKQLDARVNCYLTGMCFRDIFERNTPVAGVGGSYNSAYLGHTLDHYSFENIGCRFAVMVPPFFSYIRK